MAVARLKTVAYFVFLLKLTINAQYTDDSDYNDLEFYDDMPISYAENVQKDRANVAQDDFYILNNFEDADTQHEVYSNANDLSTPFEDNGNSLKRRDAFATQLNWYKPDRIYRYTKHRIPGYDYEELDYIVTRNFEQCDEKSLWTHCVCQFTCSEPNIVDCYTPCKSGCECKEDYVFDEKTQRCLLPEHCPSREERQGEGEQEEENFIYRE